MIVLDNLWYKYLASDKKNKQALLSIIVGFVFFVSLCLITLKYNISLCIFNNLFGIPCPGCGMTRAFISIIKLDFVSAFQYNITSIPLFLGILIYCVLCFMDFFKKTNYLSLFENFLLKKFMFVLYIILLSLAISRIVWYT